MFKFVGTRLNFDVCITSKLENVYVTLWYALRLRVNFIIE